MDPFIIFLQSCARYTSYYCSGWEITCLYKLQQPPLEDEQRYWLVCHWQRNSFLIIWSICAGWFIFVACSDFHFMFFFIIQTDEKAQLFSANSSIGWICCSKLLWSTSQLSSNVLTPAAGSSYHWFKGYFRPKLKGLYQTLLSDSDDYLVFSNYSLVACLHFKR